MTMFKSAKVTTESGHSWKTEINGSVDEIGSYFLGQSVNVKSFLEEKMERVVKVELFDFEGAKEGEKLWFNYESSDESKMYFRDAINGYRFQNSLFSNLEERHLYGDVVKNIKRETLFETLVGNALLAA